MLPTTQSPVLMPMPTSSPLNATPAAAALRARLSLSLGNSGAILAELLERRCDVVVIPDLARDKRLHFAALRDDRLAVLEQTRSTAKAGPSPVAGRC